MKSYAERREAWIAASFEAGEETGTQRLADFVAIALNDPTIMGKDVFGAARIKKIYEKLYDLQRQYGKAYQTGPEQDYYQDKLDERLRRIFPPADFVPFAQRYDHIKQPTYRKG